MALTNDEIDKYRKIAFDYLTETIKFGLSQNSLRAAELILNNCWYPLEGEVVSTDVPNS